jgi:hypothetical protein
MKFLMGFFLMGLGIMFGVVGLVLSVAGFLSSVSVQLTGGIISLIIFYPIMKWGMRIMDSAN